MRTQRRVISTRRELSVSFDEGRPEGGKEMRSREARDCPSCSFPRRSRALQAWASSGLGRPPLVPTSLVLLGNVASLLLDKPARPPLATRCFRSRIDDSGERKDGSKFCKDTRRRGKSRADRSRFIPSLPSKDKANGRLTRIEALYHSNLTLSDIWNGNAASVTEISSPSAKTSVQSFARFGDVAASS